MTQIKKIKDLISASNEKTTIDPQWDVSAIISDECISYLASNSLTKEFVIVDPKQEDLNTYLDLWKKLNDYLCIAVIDTHTHADHISCAYEVSKKLKAPLIMSQLAPSKRVDIKICHETFLNSKAGKLKFIPTPGHTEDSMTVVWGPYVFSGDVVFFGDVGRDDLPGGSAESHFDSLEKLKKELTADLIVLPGHDFKGGRASTWGYQLRTNESLIQSRSDYVSEANAFDAPAPKLLKKSLKENFK